jgi:hypothetical protein
MGPICLIYQVERIRGKKLRSLWGKVGYQEARQREGEEK